MLAEEIHADGTDPRGKVRVISWALRHEWLLDRDAPVGSGVASFVRSDRTTGRRPRRNRDDLADDTRTARLRS
jgi:hypothetical protein